MCGLRTRTQTRIKENLLTFHIPERYNYFAEKYDDLNQEAIEQGVNLFIKFLKRIEI